MGGRVSWCVLWIRGMVAGCRVLWQWGKWHFGVGGTLVAAMGECEGSEKDEDGFARLTNEVQHFVKVL